VVCNQPSVQLSHSSWTGWAFAETQESKLTDVVWADVKHV
jgi:hypothetical protein